MKTQYRLNNIPNSKFKQKKWEFKQTSVLGFIKKTACNSEAYYQYDQISRKMKLQYLLH